MAPSSNRALAAVAAAFALTATNVVQQAQAHPNCVGDFAPDTDPSSSFCPADNPDGFCCTPQQETAIEANYNSAGVTGRCAEMFLEVRTKLETVHWCWRGGFDVLELAHIHVVNTVNQCLPRGPLVYSLVP